MIGAITGEPAIIKAYQAGKDLHAATAAIVFHVLLEEVTKEQRNKAKTYNFAILYGANKYGLAYALGCTIDEAEVILTDFYNGYPVLKRVKNQIVQKVFEKKYSTTLNGRRRYFENKTQFSDPKELQKYRRKLEKEGFNHIPQGSGADITKLSLCKLYYDNPFGENFKILLTVHDEILCEVKEEIAEQALEFVIKSMEEVEQPFLGAIPAKAEGKISDVWEH